MDVSIIIINYNTFQLTCNCIQSVIQHTTGLHFEIILVDNNSTEIDPVEFVKIYPQILLIKNEINAGFSKGNNIGIEKAKGNFILLLNSDTELMNNAISICKSRLQNDNSLAVVGSRLEFPDGSIQHNCQRFPSISYKLFELFRLQKVLKKRMGGKILLGSFFDHNENIFPDWIWGTFFMFKKSLLQKLPDKKLADGFFMYVEDMEWCMEFKKLGYRIAFEPSAKVIHRMGSSGGSKLQLMKQNLNIFMYQYYSPLKIKIIRMLDYLLIR